MIPEFVPPPRGAAHAVTVDCNTLQFRVEDHDDHLPAGVVEVCTYLGGIRVAHLQAPDSPDLRDSIHFLLLRAHLLLTLTEAFPGVRGQIWAVLPDGCDDWSGHDKFADGGASWSTAGQRAAFEVDTPWAPPSQRPPWESPPESGSQLALLIGEVERLDGLRVAPGDLSAEAENLLQCIIRGTEPRLADQMLALLAA
jgi:hypothetical protein